MIPYSAIDRCVTTLRVPTARLRGGVRGVLVPALIAAIAAPCAAQTTPRLPSCPAKSDTASLLQPTDSAFGEAKVIATFLNRAGLSVRCVTRSDWAGLAGIGNVATFQTNRGTITVFIVQPSERFQMAVMRSTRGYRITYSKRGAHPTRTVIDANNPEYVVERGSWYFHMLDASLAGDVRAAVESSP
jgi:hypothetical protein